METFYPVCLAPAIGPLDHHVIDLPSSYWWLLSSHYYMSLDLFYQLHKNQNTKNYCCMPNLKIKCNERKRYYENIFPNLFDNKAYYSSCFYQRLRKRLLRNNRNFDKFDRRHPHMTKWKFLTIIKKETHCRLLSPSHANNVQNETNNLITTFLSVFYVELTGESSGCPSLGI